MNKINTPSRVYTINANHYEIMLNDFESTKIDNVLNIRTNTRIFYSYDKEICVIYNGIIYLNADFWTFSITTKKHLYKWLDLDRNQINNYLKNGKAFEYSQFNNANLPTLHELINLKSEAI
jgi:hypothetical protein